MYSECMTVIASAQAVRYYAIANIHFVSWSRVAECHAIVHLVCFQSHGNYVNKQYGDLPTATFLGNVCNWEEYAYKIAYNRMGHTVYWELRLESQLIKCLCMHDLFLVITQSCIHIRSCLLHSSPTMCVYRLLPKSEAQETKCQCTNHNHDIHITNSIPTNCRRHLKRRWGSVVTTLV